MFLKAYSLHDTKTGSYSPPVFLHADGVALRYVFEFSLDRSTDVGKYPADFVLFRVGEFDNSVGQLFATPPVNLGAVSAIAAQMRSDLEGSRFALTPEGASAIGVPASVEGDENAAS